MRKTLNDHLITPQTTVREALTRLERLGADAVLFVTDPENRLLQSLTDGDVRRGLINGLGLDHPITGFAASSPKFFQAGKFDLETVKEYRRKNYGIIPVVDAERRILEIVNFSKQRSFLPLDAVIMAGGKGSRLMPLTENTPKPLLKVGDKPIIEHNIDRLKSFGIRRLTISLGYLGEQIVEYFGDGTEKGMDIRYVYEHEPRGTMGALSEVTEVFNPHLLIMNSDVLTTVDFEEMFAHFLAQASDMTVATVPYEVKIPYGVIETKGELISNLREKPTYTYYSNAGIYLLRKEHRSKVPATGPFGAPDLMRELYENGKRVTHFPILGYWLDIGKHQDFTRAQEDVKSLHL